MNDSRTMLINRRRALTATTRTSVALLVAATSPACGQAAGGVFTPEAFGAKGDGRTNDTAAFARLAAAVTAADGGRIVLRRTVYLVGEQRPGPLLEPYSFAPAKCLQIAGCSRPLAIEGNGATLRCAPGLRYGVFDREGRRVDHPLPYTQPGQLASPYDYLVLIERCDGGVTIHDLELDGRVDTLSVGGPWGDQGYQIPAVGLFLRDNAGDEIVRNVRTHHHAQDGLMIAGTARNKAGAVKLLQNVRAEHNGRQGCSVIGGAGYRFEGCRFAHTGRGPVASPPGAGFDIEAETAAIRDLRFSRCEFSDNVGCGMVADSGDSANVRFDDCRFVGTTNWSIWPNKPGFRFTRCEFVGAAVRCFGSPDQELATRFVNCRFTDDPARSPTGKVYANGPIADLSDSRNVTFQSCVFLALHGAQLPWSTDAIFLDCTMRQAGPKQAFPRGLFAGDNRIDGAVDIAASRVRGRLVLNGELIKPRP